MMLVQPMPYPAGSGGGGEPSYGDEMVVNGGFDDPSGWTIGGGESAIDGGTLNSTESSNAVNIATQAVNLTPGAPYRVEFSVTSYTSGDVRVAFVGGSTVLGTARTAPGTYVETLTAGTGNTAIAVRTAAAGTVCSVDDISLKKLL